MIVVERKHNKVVHQVGWNVLEGMNNNAVFLLCRNKILNFA
jgi:hypothetical protein